MATIESFPRLIGFYVLTPEGELGYFDSDKKFFVDTKLTKNFEEYNRRFLMAYLQNPAQGNFRLAIIHQTQEKRPWGSETLLLEKPIVRRLYPMSGTTELDLTVFQKKNREKSVYRGMEIFLEYKDSSSPEIPVYCPVLFDRGSTLVDYAAILDRAVTPHDRQTPVVEVLNLLAGIPMGRRGTAEISVLKEKIYRGIVRKDIRKGEGFTLIENIRRTAVIARAERGEDPYAGIDKRAERQVTLDAHASPSSQSGEISLIHNLGASLVGKPVPATAQVLKQFTRFHDLDLDVLEVLASQCLIYRATPGTQLLERGTNDTWNLYLIEGNVQLTAADGVSKTIESGTLTAKNPISFLKPRMYSVSAITRVAFLWIDDLLVDQVLRDKPAPKGSDLKI